MEKFIPYEKLSKKEKRKMDLAKRQTWGELNPVTRKPKPITETKPGIGSVKANQFRDFLLNGQLNLRQPVLCMFLIPDAIDIAFPMQAGDLITVLHGIAVNVGIGLAKAVIGTLVIDTDGLGGR